MGGSVSLALEKYTKESNNLYENIQSKTYGAPAVSGNKKSPILKDIVKDEIIGTGVAGMGYIGASADSAIGFSDGGLLTRMGADIGNKVSSDFAHRIAENIKTSPDRIIYFGDPISAFDFNTKTVMPSFGFKWNNSAHSYNEVTDSR